MKMKKLLLSLLAVLFAVAGFAQPFVLTVDGFRDCKDNAKDYIVVQVPDCDKATLFQRAKNYFTEIYNSPQNVLSESGTDMISVFGADNIRYPAARATCKFSYKVVCQFKDGRCKISPVWVDFFGAGYSFPIQSAGGISPLGIYRKNGELRDANTKSKIEAIIFPIVGGLEKALKKEGAPASEDW